MSTRTAIPTDLVLNDELRALFDADPGDLSCVAIQGPGGHGKTAVLRQLAKVYGGGEGADSVLLVDDAHLLDESRLHKLRHMMEAGQRRLVVAYRPWPRSAAMAQLIETLRQHTHPLILQPFSEEQTLSCLTMLLNRGAAPFDEARRQHLARSASPRPDAFGVEAQPAMARFVHAQTGGVPVFVDRLARALGGIGGGVPNGRPLEVSRSVLIQFAAHLDDLDADVRRVLLSASTGIDVPAAVLGSLLSRGPEEVDEVLAAARATGLLGQDNSMPPIVRRAVACLTPPGTRDSVWQSLAEVLMQRGEPVLPLVRSLRDAGFTASASPSVNAATAGPSAAASGASQLPASASPLVKPATAGLAAAMESAADEALIEEPALAAELYAAAAGSGRPATARHALAAALAADLDTALRLADRLISAAASGQEREQAAMVAATALAHRGQLARSAELYRWSGSPASAAFAAITSAATGHAEELERLVRQPRAAAAPTLLSSASMLMARGMNETLSGSPTAALSAFVQACALLEPAGQAELLPDSPAALAALVGLQAGELDIAESMLESAIASRMGAALMARRHPLLQSWILMARGKTAAAAERLSTSVVGIGPVEPRDLLFAASIEVGIARRNSDLTGLQRSWTRAREAVLRHPVDLLTLLPLGELAIAAARLGDLGRLSLHLREARLLLEKLGNPALWAVPLHWNLLHAAIILEDLTAASEHAATLAAARHTPFGAVVAAAGESWLEVLRGNVDAVKVEAAARGLHGIGLAWDAARLAGQAAIRTSDRRAMTSLLDCARMLQGRPTSGTATNTLASPNEARLSDREQEVAELVLAGMTYKQIGDQLFISAKTVEHHVARMRQRLNCTSRSELLNRLRTMQTTKPAAPI